MPRFSKTTQKIFAGFFIISLFLGSLTLPPPKTAHALDIVLDPENLVQTTLTAWINKLISQATDALVQKEYIFDTIAGLAAKSLIKTISTSIQNWIKTGDARGPLFVDNFLEHFSREMDNAVGLFLERYFGKNSELLKLVCEPFRLSLPPLLNVHRRPSYTEQARCKLSDIVRNVENFQVQIYFDDFSHGGWDAWFATLDPSGNILGQYLMGVSKMDETKTAALYGSQTEVQTTGGGFLSWQDCPKEKVVDPETGEYTGDTYTDTKHCKIQTPGGLVEDQLKKSETTWIRQLEVADEINEIINVFFQEMVGKLLSPSGGFAGRDENAINRATSEPDRTPPSVIIISPVNGTTRSTTTQMDISISAIDNTGVTGVSAFVNGVSVGAEDTTYPFTVSWNPAAASPGIYSISARARDAAGNIGSTTISITLQ